MCEKQTDVRVGQMGRASVKTIAHECGDDKEEDEKWVLPGREGSCLSMAHGVGRANQHTPPPLPCFGACATPPKGLLILVLFGTDAHQRSLSFERLGEFERGYARITHERGTRSDCRGRGVGTGVVRRPKEVSR